MKIKSIAALFLSLSFAISGARAVAPGASAAGPNDLDRLRHSSAPDRANVPPHVASLIAQGDAAMKRQRYDEAISCFTAALQKKSDQKTTSELYSRRCEAFLYRKQPDKAFEDANASIRLNPGLYNPYVNRGLIHRLRGNLDQAIRDYTAGIRLNPRAIIAFNNRGIVYDRKGLYERAIQDFNAAIRLNADYANAYLNRGVTYDKMRKFDRALADFTEAIQRDPRVENAHHNRGVLYYELGDFTRAIADLDEAIRRNNDPNSRETRAKALRKMKERDVKRRAN